MKRILTIQSHVVYGHAGNSAAVFPMSRMGAEVWALNTVQFSNHTQYPQFKGSVLPAEQITEIVDGLELIGQLQRCDAVLSGYLGSATQGTTILEALKRIKKANPNAVYCCDPVMGFPEKGCIVAAGVAEFLRDHALDVADIVAPNILELAMLSGSEQPLTSVEEAVAAARVLLKRHPKTVLVKHLAHAGRRQDQFEMLLVNPSEVWHISRPLFDFPKNKQPVGVGDLTSGLLLVNLLNGKTPREALEHTTAAVYEVLRTTFEAQEYELQLVAAQDLIVAPQTVFKAERIG